jgi:hypothetical protein
MDTYPAALPEALDEDLQIVRSTLAGILDDVSSLSEPAGNAVRDALHQIDAAHADFISSLEEEV